MSLMLSMSHAHRWHVKAVKHGGEQFSFIVFYPPIHLLSPNLLFPDNPLESLLSNLRLCRCDNLGGIGVVESTAGLAVLERCGFGGAHTVASSRNPRAACAAAVGIGNTTTGDELRAVARTHVTGASVVGGDLCHGEAGKGEDSGDGETHVDGFDVFR